MEVRRGKILVLDDEEIVLESVSRILRDENYEVTVCKTGQDALEAAKTTQFSVFVTDLKMPGMSGLETMKQLVEFEAPPAIIVVTGFPSVDSALESLKIGAVDYIQKPFSPDQLVQAVDKAIARQSARKSSSRLETVYDQIRSEIASTLELKKVLGTATEGVTRLLGAQGATLSLVDKKLQQLRLLSSFGLTVDYLKKGPIDLFKSIPETCLNQQCSVISDVEHDARLQYPQAALREGIRSILSAPLVAQGNTVGVLRAYATQPKTFTQEEIDYFVRLADLSSLCIQNARRYQDTKDQYDTLRDDLWDYFDKIGWE